MACMGKIVAAPTAGACGILPGSLIALQEEMTQKNFASMVGTKETVLVTGQSRRNPNQLTGKCSRMISVNFEGDPDSVGKIVPVEITAASKTTLRGEILEGEM